MKQPKISAIAAVGKHSRAIGNKGKLIWRISDDLKRFKALTMNHPIIMGRKTFESIGKTLPGRKNIIITRNKSFKAPDTLIVHSVQEAIEAAKELDQEEVFIIGGGEIFKEALPYISHLYLTIVHDDQPGDTHFPDHSEFKTVTFNEDHTDAKPAYTFVNLEK